MNAAYRVTLRDRLAVPIINAVTRLASARYRTLIAGAIEYGMRAAARDAQLHQDAPEDWRKR